MFKRRLKWFVILNALLAGVLTARLVDIQIVHADEYAELAARQLARPVRYLRAPRGSILDRNGTVLVHDVPAWDVCIHYAVLTGTSERYLRALARDMLRRGQVPPGRSIHDVLSELHIAIADTWRRLAELTGRPVSELVEIGQACEQRIARWREDRRRRTGVVGPMREENEFHPLLEDVPDELALAVRLELEQRPWVRVVPGSRRVVEDGEALVHVLGRLGASDAARIEHDPLADDPLRHLRPGEPCGISGVERLGEPVLRGARGLIEEDFARNIVAQREPVRGADVQLTIDAGLQRRTLDILGEAVERADRAVGAAAVVIDVRSREVLVLASWPVYPYEAFAQRYEELRDRPEQPLRFRAVGSQYPPGSTCKAIALVAGLCEGVVTPGERIHCRGSYQPGRAHAFRCWIYNQYGTTHDDADDPEGQNGENAIRNSCNIYFYTVGDRLGPQRLCEWLRRFGLGRLQGTGLIEETPGIVPDAEWLRRQRGRDHQPADAWNYAIGQGEVTITALQAANVAATIASGRWHPVVLARTGRGERLGPDFEPGPPLDERALHVLRSGMWRVVNERGGTAYAARLERPGWELCGKTGSAQAMPQVTRREYTLEWPDGRREQVLAATAEEALQRFGEPRPRIVGWRAAEYEPDWDPDSGLPAHAWFVGYVQPAGTPRGAAPQGRVLAISVIVEYGGSGGHVAAPVARRIIEEALGRLGAQ